MNISLADINKSIEKIRKNGPNLMSTAITMLALSQTRAFIEDITKDVEPLLAQFTVVDSKAANATYKLTSDPTINKLTKLEQYSQSVIKLVAENKQTTTIGTQMQTELGQLPQSVNFSVAHDKILKEIKDLVTKLNASITEIMTQLKSGSLTPDQIKQSLDNMKDIGNKIELSQAQIDKTFTSEQEAVNKFSALATRAKNVVDTTPALSSGMTSLPKLDE